MTSPLYRVRDYDLHFMVADTRKLRGPWRWVPLPTKHDGKGYRRLIRQPNGIALYGTWCVLLAVSAKCFPAGTLQDPDGPLTAPDLSDKTGVPVELVEQTLTILSDPTAGIGWLEVVSNTDQSVNASGDLRATTGGIGATTGNVSLQDKQNKQDRTVQELQQEPNVVSTKPNAAKPKFAYYTWIKAGDLSDASKVLAWHARVVQVKNSPLQDTDGSRINTLAAAAMALDANTPMAWFVACIKAKFEFVTQAAEDAARVTLLDWRRQQGGANLFANLIKSTTPPVVPDMDDETPFDDGEGDE